LFRCVQRPMKMMTSFWRWSRSSTSGASAASHSLLLLCSAPTTHRARGTCRDSTTISTRCRRSRHPV